MRKSIIPATWLLGAAALLMVPALGRTQGQLAAKDDLIKKYDASGARLRELFNGNDSAVKADKKHAEAAAEWFLYRFTIKSFLTPTKNLQHPVDVMHRDFHDKITDLMDKKNNANKVDFRKMFGIALVTAMKNVLERDFRADPGTVINVAEMLPEMARLKQEEVSAYLCELAKDGKNPVVQLHAFKALKETMPVVLQPGEDDFAGQNIFNARKGRDIKNVDALRQFIDQKVDTSKMAPDEIKAVQFVRREAIISLAQAGAPAVVLIPNKKMPLPPDGPIASTLLNVLAGNVQPLPSLSEKVEAALGVCAMKYPNMPDYDPQVGIYLVGRTIEDFVTDYNKDWVNFSAVGAGRKLPYLAYLGDARRLKAGLKELAANTPNPSAKGAKDLEKLASAPILDMIVGTAKEKYLRPEVDAVNSFSALVKQLHPKNRNPFKNVNLAIPLGAK